MQLDMFNMTSKELDVLASIIWKLRSDQTVKDVKREILHDVSGLLQADFIASYIWNDTNKRSYDGISINIEDRLIVDYETNGQPHDIVTPEMRKIEYAAIVDQVIDRKVLERSVHYNEFLKPSYMHHGINVYFTDNGVDVGDLRIYRGEKDPKFTEKDVHILNVLKPYFELKFSSRRINLENLTNREIEVVDCLIKGLSDKEIAKLLNISFTTVRTHIKNIMVKLSCRNRTEIAVKADQLKLY